jgi:hypothetical protein
MLTDISTYPREALSRTSVSQVEGRFSFGDAPFLHMAKLRLEIYGTGCLNGY